MGNYKNIDFENVKVYVIIVTYNAMKWVDKCFKSLRESSVMVYPVVVDNKSTDETVRYISEHYPEVHIIKNDVNKGFGQANNQGIEYAYSQGGTNFFLLNQDAWIYNNTIEKLVSVQNHYKIAIVSPIHLNGNGNKIDANFYNMMIKNSSFINDLIFNRCEKYYEVPKINAAAWMLSKETIEHIGGFDPIFFHYGEDGNYCQRLLYHKKKIVFVPSVYINHDRTIHGNSNAFNKNRFFSDLLTPCANINLNAFKMIPKLIVYVLVHSKIAVTCLIKMDFKTLWYIIKAYMSLIFYSFKIFRSLKTNKTVGSSWLNLV